VLVGGYPNAVSDPKHEPEVNQDGMGQHGMFDRSFCFASDFGPSPLLTTMPVRCDEVENMRKPSSENNINKQNGLHCQDKPFKCWS